MSLLANLLALSMTPYTTQLYDRVLTSRSIETLLYLTLIVLGAFALLGGFELLRQRALLRLGLWAERRVGELGLRCGVEAAALGGRAEGVEALRDAAQLRNALAGPAMLALFDVP